MNQQQLKEFIKQGEMEFNKEFCMRNYLGQMEICPIRVHNYSRKDPITTTYAILREDLISWHNQQLTLAYNLGRESVVEEINAMIVNTPDEVAELNKHLDSRTQQQEYHKAIGYTEALSTLQAKLLTTQKDGQNCVDSNRSTQLLTKDK